MPLRSRVTAGVGQRGVHFLALLALFGFIIAVTTSEWVVYHADIDLRKDPMYGRGLWQAFFYDGYGVITSVSYSETDANDVSQNPFCGSAGLENPLFNSRVMDNQTIQVWGKMMGTRDLNTHNWCHKRHTTAILACITVVVSWLAAIASGCAQRSTTLCRKRATAIFCTITAILGIAATSVFGSWYMHEHRTAQNDVVSVSGGFSFGMFILSWISSGVAAAAVIFDLYTNPQSIVAASAGLSIQADDIPPAYASEGKARLVVHGQPNTTSFA